MEQKRAFLRISEWCHGGYGGFGRVLNPRTKRGGPGLAISEVRHRTHDIRGDKRAVSRRLRHSRKKMVTGSTKWRENGRWGIAPPTEPLSGTGVCGVFAHAPRRARRMLRANSDPSNDNPTSKKNLTRI